MQIPRRINQSVSFAPLGFPASFRPRAACGFEGVGLALSARLEIRQGQGLVITPQLQQAIKLLQLSNLELEAFVEAELERNPLLQRDEAEAKPPTWALTGSTTPPPGPNSTPRTTTPPPASTPPATPQNPWGPPRPVARSTGPRPAPAGAPSRATPTWRA